MSSVITGIFLSVLGVCLGAVSIGYMVYIERKQKLQLTEMDKIGKDTHDIADSLVTDHHKRRMLEKFYCPEEKCERFKCIFPALETDTPFIDMHVGDYYPLHHIQTVLDLDIDRLDVRSDKDAVATVSGVGTEGHTIYLGTPQVNKALKKVAPAIELTTGLVLPVGPDLALSSGTIRGGIAIFNVNSNGGITVPCWFSNENYSADSAYRAKTILHYDSENQQWDTIRSGVEDMYEDIYRKTHTQDISKVPVIPSTLQDDETKCDYAIILRLNTNTKHKTFVIAGIHQYGTWIAGEFLRRLADKFQDESNRSIIRKHKQMFLQKDCDFIAVVTGDLSINKLTATKPRIYRDFMWIYMKDKWARISSPNFDNDFRSSCPSAYDEES